MASPLVGALLSAADAFGARCMDVLGFQARVLALLQALPPREALASHVAKAVDGRCNVVLARRLHEGGRSDQVQVTYVAAGEAHACHCHNNVVSTQVLLAGALEVREFDRVGHAVGGGVLLRLLYEGRMRAGDYLQTREGARNGHWFAAGAAAAILLELTLHGYERAVFYAPGERPLGQVLLDPTQRAEGELLLGRPISEAEARARFGRRRLADFPMPAPLETAARSLDAA